MHLYTHGIEGYFLKKVDDGWRIEHDGKQSRSYNAKEVHVTPHGIYIIEERERGSPQLPYKVNDVVKLNLDLEEVLREYFRNVIGLKISGEDIYAHYSFEKEDFLMRLNPNLEKLAVSKVYPEIGSFEVKENLIEITIRNEEKVYLDKITLDEKQ